MLAILEQWHELKEEGKGQRDLEAAFASYRELVNPSAHTTNTGHQNIPRARPDESQQRRRDQDLGLELQRLLEAEKAAERRQRQLAVGREMEQLPRRVVTFPPVPKSRPSDIGLAMPSLPAQQGVKTENLGFGGQGGASRGSNGFLLPGELKPRSSPAIKIEPGIELGAYITAQFQPLQEPTHRELPILTRTAKENQGWQYPMHWRHDEQRRVSVGELRDMLREANNMVAEPYVDGLQSIRETLDQILRQQQDLVASMQEQRDLNRGLTNGLEEQKRMIEEHVQVVKTQYAFVVESIERDENRESRGASEYDDDGFESGPEPEDPDDRTYISAEDEKEDEEEDVGGVNGEWRDFDEVPANDRAMAANDNHAGGAEEEEEEYEVVIKQEEENSEPSVPAPVAGQKRKARVQKRSPIPAKKTPPGFLESPIPNPYLEKIAKDRAREREQQEQQELYRRFGERGSWGNPVVLD